VYPPPVSVDSRYALNPPYVSGSGSSGLKLASVGMSGTTISPNSLRCIRATPLEGFEWNAVTTPHRSRLMRFVLHRILAPMMTVR